MSNRVCIGGVAIGGGEPVAIQSMTNTDTADTAATLSQVEELTMAGCEIVRVSVPNDPALTGFAALRQATDAPLVADIHFRWQLAVGAIKAGADKVRINPGNISDAGGVARIIEAAGIAGVPIRVGVNAGSLSRKARDADLPLWRKLVESAVEFCGVIEAMGFTDIVVSAKGYDVPETVRAYRELAKLVDYPLHLGITEAGTALTGAIRSAVGLGILLDEVIGDTIRVSLAADPVEEIKAAQQILAALDMRKFGPELLACPTCARCGVDLFAIAGEVEERLKDVKAPLRVAVMGCVVNGPGEAARADVGIAAEKGGGVLFAGGKAVARVAEEDLVDSLMKLIGEYVRQQESEN